MTTTKSTAKKSTAKKSSEKIAYNKLKNQATLAIDRKGIYKTVEGTATPYRIEGRKQNRKHTVKYTEGEKKIVKILQVIYMKELREHKKKNILELINSKGTYYYFVTPKN